MYEKIWLQNCWNLIELRHGEGEEPLLNESEVQEVRLVLSWERCDVTLYMVFTADADILSELQHLIHFRKTHPFFECHDGFYLSHIRQDDKDKKKDVTTGRGRETRG